MALSERKGQGRDTGGTRRDKFLRVNCRGGSERSDRVPPRAPWVKRLYPHRSESEPEIWAPRMRNGIVNREA